MMTQDARKGQFGEPVERLKREAAGLAGALAERGMSLVLDRIEGTAGRLAEYVEDGAGPGLRAAMTGAKDLAEGKGPVRAAADAGVKWATEKVRGLFGGKGGAGKKLKVTNIIESVDVGVPIDVAYNQWTQFSDFPSFMRKVENVDQDDNEPQKLHWKAQVFWSHREWDAEVIDQIPEERIIWRSQGQKGHVDGAVTFHKLAPSLTRILVVLEYHPQGLFEHTGNLWRPQGRRARLELKHFGRHVMTNTILHPEELEGWRGVIEDGEVVQDHEEALAQDEQGDDQADDRAHDDELEGEEPASDQDEIEGTGADDEYTEDEDEDESRDAEDEDEYAEDEDEEPSPTARAAGRPARSTEGARASMRDRRPAGGQRSGRRAGERLARPVRRRLASRGEP